MSSYKTASVSGRSIDFCLFCRLAFNSHVKALSFSTPQFVIYEVDYSRDLILLKSSLHLCVHACLHAQLLRCVSLCNPMDCIPPGSSVPGISHARILEWIAISYSGDLPKPGIETTSPELQADSLPLSHQESPCILRQILYQKASSSED